MRFLKYVLEQIDMVWMIWMVIVTPIAILIAANIIPVPVVIFMLFVIKHQFTKTKIVNHLNDNPGGCYLNAVVYAISTIAVFALLVHLDIQSNKVCLDFTGDLPWTLPEILSHFVCP